MTDQSTTPAAPREVTVAELATMAGVDLGATDWTTIDQDRINLFADATDDHQWIHVDPERAAAGPFGRTIAHGYLTLALVPRLLESLLTITDQARGTNYGLERVRFTNPVPVGSRVRMAAEIAAATQREDGGVQYTVSVRVDIEGQERPAMIGQTVYLAYAPSA